MRTVTSELLKIRGVGPEKRRALLNAFGSVQGVRDAGAEEISKLPGFSMASAQKLLTALLPPGDVQAVETSAVETVDVTHDPNAQVETTPEAGIAEQG